MLILMWFVGYLMLVLAYSIPTGGMEVHVREAASTFQKEGSYPQLAGMGTSQLDNFTDALMLLTASYPCDRNVWRGAVDAKRYHINGENPVKTLLNVYGEAKAAEAIAYERYWHGYLIFLKPLLLFFSYTQIRYFFMAGQLFLFSLLIASLAARKKELVIPTAFLWLFMNPMATMCSLQFNSIIVVAFSAMILIVVLNDIWKDDIDKWGLLFLCIGGVTSYLDLLTYPLVALGAPLILFLSFRGTATMRSSMRYILTLSSFWVIGYAGMWAGKWILGSVITGEDIIGNAFAQIQLRTSPFLSREHNKRTTFVMVIKKMLEYSWKYIMMSAIVALSYVSVYKLRQIKRLKVKNILPYAVIGIYPFGWYLASRNHSYIHAFFTYRELAITVYAIMVSAASCKD